MREPPVGRQQIPNANQLFDDLSGGQVARDTVEAAGTENATHSATDLGAYARSMSAVFLEQHAFDELVVVQPQ